MNRKSVNLEIRKRVQKFFEGYTRHEVTANDVDEFMTSIQQWLQETAHTTIKDDGLADGLMYHMDRQSFKHCSRLYALQQIGIHYPSAVIEYLYEVNRKRKQMEKEVIV